jgi:chromosome segregation ATPase
MRQALEADLARQHAEAGARERALVQARADFSGELEKLRASAELAEERLRATEKRALLKIERERMAGSQLQKELDGAMQRTEQGALRHQSELQTLQAQLADARHQAGRLEGSLAAVQEANGSYARELERLRQQGAGSVRRRDRAAMAPTRTRSRAGGGRGETG